MLKTIVIIFLLYSTSLFANANNIQIGQTVPTVKVEQSGEILIKNNKIYYKPWITTQMLGKVRVIQAIAGRSGAKMMNAPLMIAITEANFSADDYQTTTIVNQDDAIWGTGSFVKSSAEDGKEHFPWSSMVLDKNGVVADLWQLTPKSSTIIVQDKMGKVLFNKTGTLTNEEINRVLQLIKRNI